MKRIFTIILLFCACVVGAQPYAKFLGVKTDSTIVRGVLVDSSGRRFLSAKFTRNSVNSTANDSVGNIVIGHPAASIEDGYANLIIGGGTPAVISGTDTFYNRIYGRSGLRLILGGYHNKIYNSLASSIIDSKHCIIDSTTDHVSIIASTYDTIKSSQYGKIIGCIACFGSGDDIMMLGGRNNRIIHSPKSSIINGTNNTMDTADYSFIASSSNVNFSKTGRYSSAISSSNSTLTQVNLSTILASNNANIRNSQYSTVLGSSNASVTGSYRSGIYVSENAAIDTLSTGSVILGVKNAHIKGLGSAAIGGSDKTINGNNAGSFAGQYHFFDNNYTNDFSIILGGNRDTIGGRFNTIVGARRSAITGGGEYNNILYGDSVRAIGVSYSVIGGRRAKTTASGTLTFSDAQGEDFINSTPNSVAMRFAGGYNFSGGPVKIEADNNISGDILIRDSVTKTIGIKKISEIIDVSGKQNFTDTATWDATKADLNSFLGEIPVFDSASLSNRIDLKQSFLDTFSFDATKSWVIETINDLPMPQTLSESATEAQWDWDLGLNAELTITKDLTSGLSIIGSHPGQQAVLKVIQDGTGGHQLFLGSPIKTIGGAGITLSAAPGAIDVIHIYFDGTFYYATIDNDFQ